ncbi:MAG TPA: hypothetical protein VH092_10635 [Urbifossiella sp.]|jgi:hypothetical protein|nr:hypothetical protein [Urbifossiella sp.]
MVPEPQLTDGSAPPSAAPSETELTPEQQAAADETIRAQVEDWIWLDEMRNAGQLEAYRGEIVFVAGKQILARSPNMFIGRAVARMVAEERGIPVERVSNYLVPGYE